MSALILPGSPGWFGMVSPREEEMPDFLKVIAQGWRTPQRKWEDLWRLRRGELNHVLGMRQFGSRKHQRGSVGCRAQVAAAQQGTGGTIPGLFGVTQTESNVAPTASRVYLAYDSDGTMDFYSSTALTPTYATLTTQSDDANNHTTAWWPDNPETNEGLNWDIRYTNNTSGGTVTSRRLFATALVDRTVDVWYLLDTVSNDHADADQNGALGVNRNNGTAKNPQTGNGNTNVDVEIRVTGSGSAVASHSVFLQAIGT